MPLRGIEGGGAGGLDPRRARLAHIHDFSIVGLAASGAGFLLVGFFFVMGEWGPAVGLVVRIALVACALGVVGCVATVYMVAMIYDTDPRTRRELRGGMGGGADR